MVRDGIQVPQQRADSKSVVQGAWHTRCDILPSPVTGTGIGKTTMSVKIICVQASHPVNNNLPTAAFEAIPCSISQTADDINNTQIILQKGE